MSELYRFGAFELDATTGELRKSGVRVKLGGQPLEVLTLLVQRQGELVTREDLKDALWKEETFTDFDHGVNTAVQRIRRALDDSAQSPRFVETLPRKGYRFVAPVDRIAIAAEVRPTEGAPAPSRNRLLWSAAALLAVALAIGQFWGRPAPEPVTDEPLRRFSYALPVEVGSASFTVTASISPNGKHIAFVGPGENGSLWIQDLDKREPRKIEGTEGADGPFWSRDSRQIGFEAKRGLYVANLEGTSVRKLLQGYEGYRGGTFSLDSASIFWNRLWGLAEIPATGGEPRQVISVDEPGEVLRSLMYPGFSNSHLEIHGPQFLPFGPERRVLIYSVRNENPGVVVHDLDSGYQKILVMGGFARYSPTGHILYQPSFIENELWALPLSLDTLDAAGTPFLVEKDARGPTFADDGTMVYVDGLGAGRFTLVIVDRQGKQVGEIGDPFVDVYNPRVSPDGQYLLANIDGGTAIWELETERMVARLENGSHTVWAPDSKRIAYVERTDDSTSVFIRRINGASPLELVGEADVRQTVVDWSDDGRILLVNRGRRDGAKSDLDYYRWDDAGERWSEHDYLNETYAEHTGSISPDNRYVAFSADFTDNRQIYVKALPDDGNIWRLSPEGGDQPQFNGTQPYWNPNGEEILFLHMGTLMSVPVSTTPTFSHGEPEALFEMYELPANHRLGRTVPQYEVLDGGRRFVKIQPIDRREQARRPQILVVQNWYQPFRSYGGD